MEKEPWPASGLELGQQKIIDAVKEELTSRRVDLSRLIFRWETDTARSQWLLLVYKGKKRHIVRFLESDFKALPNTTGILEKYSRKIMNVAQCLSLAQRRNGPEVRPPGPQQT